MILNKEVELEVNEKKVKIISYKESKWTLGVYMSPSLMWNKQFEIMREKILEAICKLKNATIAVHNACMYYNMYLIKKSVFWVWSIEHFYLARRWIEKDLQTGVIKKT